MARCLGCVYIMPTRKRGHDCKVTLWVRAWIADVWPFSNPALPGRAVSFEDWRALPED